MTNEEVKKKIVEIINSWAEQSVASYRPDGASVYNPYNAAELADALIAAGIGDVSELEVKCEVLQRDVDNLTRTLEEGMEELKEANRCAEVAAQVQLLASKRALQLSHKAKVAERALQIAEELGELCAPAKNYIDRAKKELAKENKQ